MDNVYVSVGGKVFRQVVGIPMGTNCAPFLANLFLYALEYKYMEKLARRDIVEARKLSDCFRFIDDLLCLNHGEKLAKAKHEIYPAELCLNRENKTNRAVRFLDLKMSIEGSRINTALFDKRDEFRFKVNKYPHLSSNVHKKRTHGIVISQLMRFAKACMRLPDFVARAREMIKTLMGKAYDIRLIKKKLSTFYDKYYSMVCNYNVTKKQLFGQIFYQ